eukprot:TRINITY_DN888_c0_g2_i1.p1 TRINITY_DN888_c0_g2~~TRINITY_DN888_c0_g2_i1.p1  ORF type:complete len:253 (+),score=64.23 TRINITY_DN888_c0_g2_i1:119-877(+)
MRICVPILYSPASSIAISLAQRAIFQQLPKRSFTQSSSNLLFKTSAPLPAFFLNRMAATGPKKLHPKSTAPVVIAGPSGVGKSTLIKMLMTDYPEDFGFSVSHTSRKPREGEIDGVHYYFSTREAMQELVQKGEFIENAEYAGNFYGTSKQAVRSIAEKGKICILDVDSQGILSLKKTDLGCRYIFIAPPSIEELERRLVKRGESRENIDKRLKQAQIELEYVKVEGFFDDVVVNNNLETAYGDLEKAILKL